MKTKWIAQSDLGFGNYGSGLCWSRRIYRRCSAPAALRGVVSYAGSEAMPGSMVPGSGAAEGIKGGPECGKGRPTRGRTGPTLTTTTTIRDGSTTKVTGIMNDHGDHHDWGHR